MVVTLLEFCRHVLSPHGPRQCYLLRTSYLELMDSSVLIVMFQFSILKSNVQLDADMAHEAIDLADTD